ncbi:PilZ domain-containing protein [Deltaproteobacteria bacterium TL4]
MGVEQRKEERKNVHVVAEMQHGYQEFHVVCSDISGGGCKIRVTYMMLKGSRIRLKLYGKGEGDQVKVYEPISGIVRWCYPIVFHVVNGISACFLFLINSIISVT